MRMILGMAVLAGVVAGCARPGVVERACFDPVQGGNDRVLCGCIQQAADATLDRRDQKRAARFFEDPHRAQEIRQSDRPGDERFWRKYRAFGAAAERSCS